VSERVDILVVDDHPDKLVAIGAILSELGQNVVNALSGKEALRHLLHRDFAVILLDVNMPIMDGFETAALIRTRPRCEHTPIIFITAHGDETHVARGYSLGAVDYILTPVVPEVLRAKVSVFVELFRKTEEVRRQSTRLRQRAAQLHDLTRASLAINAAASVDEILQVVVERARGLLGPPRAVAEVRIAPDRLCRATSPMGDAPEIEAPGSIASITAHDGVPIGAVRLAPRPEGELTAEDEDVLVQLAQMASIAIQNMVFAEERETNRLKDEFLATVSHELRTPLTAMLTWAALLRGDKLDAARRLRGLEVIERSARAQAKVIDDLLDMSRIMTGKMHLEVRLTDVRTVIRGALDSVAPAAEAKAIALVPLLATTPMEVLGDPDRLQQIMWNLLSNAIRFTPKGGRIDVGVRLVEGDVEISVRDSGAGISREFLPHVFDRFRQAESASTRSHSGLGLGLAIVRHLVDLHGGAVRAESLGKGHGATFVVTLPVAARREDGAAAPVLPRPRPDEVGAGVDAGLGVAGLRVLVVEDDVDGCEAIASVLGFAGAEVRTAGSVRAALEVLGSWTPDVLVSDIGLPGEDGYALLRHVRAQEGTERLPAIALTAYAQAHDRTRALSAGFEAHVTKPVEPDELLRVLARFREPEPAAEGQPVPHAVVLS
jgi:signal transduction histidine kinase